ncbi:serine hydrolase [uncultured Limosilactobacillus sp.]|uniref:serine hydrolase n=1 Tax=uncultured Limosilactobacillus sp. TaxID=2837629 RepID=UPI0025E6C40A|nr:serine hydrolase [uncultured Limosilactobacillus sp.]
MNQQQRLQLPFHYNSQKIRKVIKWFITCLAVVGMVVSPLGATTAKAAAIDANAVLAVDASTGQVLYQQNASQSLPIASMSKLLTMIVIEQEIKAGKLSWNSQLKITQAEAELSENTEYSNITLEAGKSYTVKELVTAALLKSADAATITLSRATGDNTAEFAQKMTKAARKIGVKDAKIYNAVGLTNEQMGTFKTKGVAADAENQMSAKDVALIAQYVIKKYPDLLKITQQSSATVAGQTVENTNSLLTGFTYHNQQVKIDGLKTGTSDQAGNCFVSTGKYRGHRLITVIMHAGGSDSSNRFTQTQKLYETVLGSYSPHWLTAKYSVKVAHAKSKKVKLVYQSASAIWVKKGTKLKQPKIQLLKVYQTKSHKLKAPVKTSDQVANAVYQQAQGLNGGKLKVALYPEKSLPKLNAFMDFFRTITGQN